MSFLVAFYKVIPLPKAVLFPSSKSFKRSFSENLFFLKFLIFLADSALIFAGAGLLPDSLKADFCCSLLKIGLNIYDKFMNSSFQASSNACYIEEN